MVGKRSRLGAVRKRVRQPAEHRTIAKAYRRAAHLEAVGVASLLAHWDGDSTVEMSSSLRNRLDAVLGTPESRLRTPAEASGHDSDIVKRFAGLSSEQEFADFDAVLDYVNPILARSAEALEGVSRDMSRSLAAMEARAERIDRTQAETRALLNGLTESA
jgi:hypothetical protein